MKKVISLILLLILCLSLCACSSSGNAAGVYIGVGWDNSEVYTLNENKTYEKWELPYAPITDGVYDEALKSDMLSLARVKGTYEATRNGFELDGYAVNKEKDFYYHTSRVLTKDMDYGMEVTFSKDGKCNQTFFTSAHTGNNCKRIDIITFFEDGTFDWYRENYRTENGHKVSSKENEYEGTYSLDGKILTLQSSERTYIFIYSDNVIYLDIYQKIQ